MRHLILGAVLALSLPLAAQAQEAAAKITAASGITTT